MKLPSMVNILGVPYSVQEKAIVSRDEPRKGEIDFIKCEITIDEALPDASKVQVLFHECLHAICDLLGFYDIGEDENKGAVKKQLQESRDSLKTVSLGF